MSENINEEKAYIYTLKLISRRIRSEEEICKKLLKKFNENVVKNIITRLKKENLINDEKFAMAFIHTREALKPKGRKVLFLELRQKGIDKDLINKILEKEYNQEKEFELAKKAAKGRIERYKNLPEKKAEQKIISFLLRRGFSWSVIKKVIRN